MITFNKCNVKLLMIAHCDARMLCFDKLYSSIFTFWNLSSTMENPPNLSITGDGDLITFLRQIFDENFLKRKKILRTNYIFCGDNFVA